nr:unnamed protein product [Digitaria exilis]
MADVAANEGEQEAAAAPSTTTAAPDVNARPPDAILDPQLFMAARRGDSKRLKELLQLRNDGERRERSLVVVKPTAATTPSHHHHHQQQQLSLMG